ncbi:MAG TPA: GNAT family N-acetyltransferase [Caulobacteraceae bacterium]|nr:GNAT family N-acetyltransferase [Caulobacteraceae bacterium]
MNVRLAERADGAALARVHAEAFEAPWPEADIRRFATDRGGFALLAEDAGALAGFILCRVIAGEAEVLTLAVRPARRRRGAARALVQAAMALAGRTAGAMFLEVAADNPGAIALYDAAGFAPVGRRTGYYARAGARAVDAIVMRRRLNT